MLSTQDNYPNIIWIIYSTNVHKWVEKFLMLSSKHRNCLFEVLLNSVGWYCVMWIHSALYRKNICNFKRPTQSQNTICLYAVLGNKQTNKKLILFNNMYRQDRYSSVTFREQIMRVWKLIRKWIFRFVFCLFLMQHSTEFWAMKQIHF